MHDAPIRVGTFNLHHGAPPHRGFDRRGLRRAGAQLGVDILALQEVDRRTWRGRFSDQAAIVAEASGLHATFAAARPMGPLGRYGIALLTPAAPTALEVIELPAFGREQRVAIVASVTVRGRRLSVAATHLHNRPWIAARQLPVVLDRLLARPGPHLLLGDLNAGRRALGPVVSDAGLTWPEASPTFPTRAPEAHLDWIAAGGGLVATNARVPDIWQSDHFPLVADLEELSLHVRS